MNNNISNLEWINFIAIYNITSNDIIDQIDSRTSNIIKTWSSYKPICDEFDITWNQLNESIKNKKELCNYLWILHPVNNEIDDGKWKIIDGYQNYEVSDTEG